MTVCFSAMEETLKGIQALLAQILVELQSQGKKDK